MSSFPQYVLKQKQLNKRKTVVIFRRNYLDIKNFTKTDDGWVFEENFNHYGTKGYLKITIRNDDIFSMYTVNTKCIKIKGKKNCFGIFVRFPKLNVPFEHNMIIGCVECFLSCSGRKLAFDNGKGIANTKLEKAINTELPQYHSKTSIEIPAAVRWSVSHPLQGGRISPK